MVSHLRQLSFDGLLVDARCRDMISSRVTLVPYHHSRSAFCAEASFGEGIAGIPGHCGVATHWSAFRVDGDPLNGRGRKVGESQERAARNLLTGPTVTVTDVYGESTGGIGYVAAAAAALEDDIAINGRIVAACHCKLYLKKAARWPIGCQSAHTEASLMVCWAEVKMLVKEGSW